MRILVVVSVVAASVLVTGFLGVWTIGRALRQSPPAPFPLEDSSATYTIGKLAGNYTLKYTKPGKSVEVLIGKSPNDLDLYVGRRVRISGTFADQVSNTQCIEDRCHLLFKDARNYAVVVNVAAVGEVKQ